MEKTDAQDHFKLVRTEQAYGSYESRTK